MRLLTLNIAATFAGLSCAQGNLVALLQTQPELSTLLDLITLTKLSSTLSSLSNVTIIAPTNTAFAQVDPEIPEGKALASRNLTAVTALLENHVFQGYYPSSNISNVPTFVQSLLGPNIRNNIQPFTEFSDYQYNGLVKTNNTVEILSGELAISNVVQLDIHLGDGIVIHVVDSIVFFAPPLLLYAARAGYTSFNAAVTAAKLDLNLGLEGSEPETNNLTDFTVFIPENQAFNSIASVLASANASTVKSIISYHMLANNVIFSSSMRNFTAPTLQGSSLTFTVANNGSIWVNGARVVLPNVILSNGVVHIIDNVLNPLTLFDRTQIRPNVQAPSRVAFANAIAGTSLPFSSVSFARETGSAYTTPALLTEIPAVSVLTSWAARTLNRPAMGVSARAAATGGV